jgi:hypothetical protein
MPMLPTIEPSRGSSAIHSRVDAAAPGASEPATLATQDSRQRRCVSGSETWLASPNGTPGSANSSALSVICSAMKCASAPLRAARSRTPPIFEDIISVIFVRLLTRGAVCPIFVPAASCRPGQRHGEKCKLANFFLRFAIGAHQNSARVCSVCCRTCVLLLLALLRVSNKRVAMADVLGPGGLMEVAEEEIIHK